MMQKPDLEKIKLHAIEARNLRDNPAFERAILGAKKYCLDALATVDPLDTEEIRTIQANIRAIDLLAEMIANEIIRGSEPRQIGLSVA